MNRVCSASIFRICGINRIRFSSIFLRCRISRVRFASIFTGSGISRFILLRYRKRSQDRSFVPPLFRYRCHYYSKLVDQYKNLRRQKIALINALLMQMVQNIYILQVSCKINDTIYIKKQMVIKGVRNLGLLSVSQRTVKEASFLVK
jgi:hypothetical protein